MRYWTSLKKWNIELILYSIYSKTKKYKYWTIQRWHNLYIVFCYRYKGKIRNYTHGSYHIKVLSGHMIFLSLGWHLCVDSAYYCL